LEKRTENVKKLIKKKIKRKKDEGRRTKDEGRRTKERRKVK
jgi:hypothetical protein